MPKIKSIFIMVSLLALLASTAFTAIAQDEGNEAVDERFVGSVPAPEFPSDLDWLNVDTPLSLDGLRGKIILFDFWTYGCINCIHMIPVLRQLEEKYANELVVIGVHSAKFENEGETDNISQIVQRYDLHHPIINDSDFRIWRAYGVNAWPTLALLDPRGNVVARQAGEIPFDALDAYIGAMIDYYDNLGTDEINREPLEIALEGAGNPGTPLLYPGKVLVDEAGNRLFIADSNHHRIVVTDLETYEVLNVIGTGQRGFTDGDFATVQFDQPQGMEIDGSTLYVADTNNHAIRKIDLANGSVSTIAGNGEKGLGGVSPGQVIDQPLDFSLRSPWDVQLGDDGLLYIAMAGTHQIWAYDLNSDTIFATVGNGREALLNTTLAASELAQPSGLDYVDGKLYFADSESSSIRVADFNENRVDTLAGPAENTLFDFGDVDGAVGTSRLQHALGVTSDHNGNLYIADTYNSRIKHIDPDSAETTTIFGLGGNGGYRDGDSSIAEFDEPGGLDYSDGKLYVADTNNHTIRVINLDEDTVATVEFPNAEALVLPDSAVTILGSNAAENEIIRLEPQNVQAGEGEIRLDLELPDGFKINDLINSTLTIQSDGVVQLDDATQVVSEPSIIIPVAFAEGDETVTASLTLYYCRDDENSLCFIDDVTFEAPVTVQETGENAIQFTKSIHPPEEL